MSYLSRSNSRATTAGIAITILQLSIPIILSCCSNTKETGPEARRRRQIHHGEYWSKTYKAAYIRISNFFRRSQKPDPRKSP
ncbi:MAG: hypothetical protein WA395_04460 [Nitrososphaeraceae archaeon]